MNAYARPSTIRAHQMAFKVFDAYIAFSEQRDLVAMFDLAEAGDGTCAALLNQILTKEEWKILEVCLMQCAL